MDGVVVLTDRVVDLTRLEVRRGDERTSLSATEARLLGFLAARPGQTFARDVLLREVWGYAPGVESRTVFTTIARLRSRIEADPSNPVHVLSTRGAGYRFEPVAVEVRPPPVSRMFGRGRELALLVEMIERHRLVTVTGMGGVGKTHLARALADHLATAPGSTRPTSFCDLSEVDDEDGLLRAVAMGLGVPLGHDAPTQVGDALRGRAGELVILDNFEQIVGLGGIVARWVQGAPHTRFVTTSRVRLGVRGERVLPLEPLGLPEGRDSDNDAIALFFDRAAAADPRIDLVAALPYAVEIVRALEGLPLAIELAAARVRVLGLQALAARLATPLRVLSSSNGPHPPRQATLRASLDWSWSLLDPHERAVFVQCAVFVGGFTLEAAESVVDLGEEGSWVLDPLQGLVDHGLLTLAEGGAEPRYRYLATVRAYAAERLSADPLRQHARVRHGHFFAAFAGGDALEALHGPDGDAVVTALVADLDNLLAATAGAVDRGDAPVAAACALSAATVLELVGPAQGIERLVSPVLELPVTDLARARLLLHLGRARRATRGVDAMLLLVDEALAVAPPGSLVEARASMHRAHALLGAGRPDAAAQAASVAHARLRACGAPRHRLAWARMFDGNLALHCGDYDAAEVAYEEARDLARACGDRALEATIAGNRALVEGNRGRPRLPGLAEALALHRACGNQRNEARVLGTMAVAYMDAGELDEAERCFMETLTLSARLGATDLHTLDLGNLGNLRLLQGRHEEAIDLYARVIATCVERNDARLEAINRTNLAHARACALDHPATEDDLAEVDALFRQAIDAHRHTGNPRSEAMGRLNLADFRRRAERIDGAREEAEAAVRYLETLGNTRLHGLALGVLGDVEAAGGRLHDARTHLATGLSLLDGHTWPADLAMVLCRVARFESEHGDADEGRRALSRAEALVGQLGGAAPRSELGLALQAARRCLAPA